MTRHRLAVLGSPIGHSRSPQLHTACYGLLGRDDLHYSAIDVDQASFAEFWSQLDASWLGLSLTMPLKQEVLPFLAGVDAFALRTGAANTVLFTDEGPLGFNTDVIGFLEVLKSAGFTVESPAEEPRAHSGAHSSAQSGAYSRPGAFGAEPSAVAPAHSPAQEQRPLGLFDDEAPLILGAGATAASALCALAELGMKHVRIAARREDAVTELARRFPAVQVVWEPLLGVEDDVASTARATRLVINTLPAAALTADVIEHAVAGHLNPNATLIDSLYEPSPPPLLAAWRAAGGVGVDGLELLREQGLAQVLLFTGAVVDESTLMALRSAAHEAIH